MRALLPCLLLSIGLALVPRTAPAQGEDGVILIDPADPAMQDAVRQARESLDLFLTWALPGPWSEPSAALKVYVPTPSGTEEVIWVAPFQRSGAGFSGILANQPLYLPDLQLGSEISFGADQVADWSWQDETGMLYGNFTTRVIRDTGEVADPALSALSDQPIPTEWR